MMRIARALQHAHRPSHHWPGRSQPPFCDSPLVPNEERARRQACRTVAWGRWLPRLQGVQSNLDLELHRHNHTGLVRAIRVMHAEEVLAEDDIDLDEFPRLAEFLAIICGAPVRGA
jgi:hypothetical protein